MKGLGLGDKRNGKKITPGEISALAAAVGALVKTIRDKLSASRQPGSLQAVGHTSLEPCDQHEADLGVGVGAIIGEDEAHRLSSPSVLGPG